MQSIDPVISIKEARKLLGIQSRLLDDAQIAAAIKQLSHLADNFLDLVLESNNLR